MSSIQIFTAEDKSGALSILKDPLASSRITDVDLHWYKRETMGQEWTKVYATITFKNGDTVGHQTINAQTMSELIQKVEAFVKTIPK